MISLSGCNCPSSRAQYNATRCGSVFKLVARSYERGQRSCGDYVFVKLAILGPEGEIRSPHSVAVLAHKIARPTLPHRVAICTWLSTRGNCSRSGISL